MICGTNNLDSKIDKLNSFEILVLKIMQITIQKKFLILYEIAENVYAIFLIVVNYVFDLAEKTATDVVQKVYSSVEKTRNFIQAIFGFNIYKLQVLKINNKNLNLDNYNNSIRHFNNQNDRVRYSNLLAPPCNF